MNPEDGLDKLDSKLKEQGAVVEKLHGGIAEYKEASEELKKALEKLDAAAEKIAKEQG
jgi:methyl-accepting chemotaxis protein